MAWSRRLTVVGLVLMSLVAAWAALRPKTPVRLAYDEIRAGMTDAEVNQITCRRGLLFGSGTCGPDEGYCRSFGGETGDVLTVFFTNGRVKEKDYESALWLDIMLFCRKCGLPVN